VLFRSIATTEEVTQSAEGEHHVHLPSPSYWPLVAAIGLPIIGYGIIYTLWLTLVGSIITAGALYAWAMEPPDEPDADAGGHPAPLEGAAPEGEPEEVLAGAGNGNGNGNGNGASAGSDTGDAPGDREVETVG
jgi:cytochrome c oxidase subunit 1